MAKNVVCCMMLHTNLTTEYYNEKTLLPQDEDSASVFSIKLPLIQVAADRGDENILSAVTHHTLDT